MRQHLEPSSDHTKQTDRADRSSVHTFLAWVAGTAALQCGWVRQRQVRSTGRTLATAQVLAWQTRLRRENR